MSIEKLPIPDDWGELDGYAFALFCVPNSVMWRALVRGKLYELSRGRVWDERSGRVTDAQIIGRTIGESLIMTCADELLKRLDRIAQSNLLILASLNSNVVDLDQPLDEPGKETNFFWRGERDFSATGLGARLSDELAYLSHLEVLSEEIPDINNGLETMATNSGHLANLADINLDLDALLNLENLAYIKDDLADVSDALVELNEKIAERMTWDDMLADLAATLGVGNAIYKLIKWFGDLFPSLKLKVDVGPYALGLLEHLRWKMPILAMLSSITASLAAIAASSVAERPLSLLRTIFGGLNTALNINNKIYDFVLGDWNWYDNVVKPLWDDVISEPDGAFPTVEISNAGDMITCAPDVTVNCGGGGGCYGEPGDGERGGTWEPPAVDPEEEFEIDQDKCDRVTYIAEQFIAHTGNLAGIASITNIDISAAVSMFVMGTGVGIIALAAPGFVIVLAGVVCGAIIGGVVGVSLLQQWASDLEAAKSDFICAAYNAKTSVSLTAAVRSWIEDTIPALGAAWTDKYVELVASPGVIAWVLTGEGFTASDLPVGDCSDCEEKAWFAVGCYLGYFLAGDVTIHDNGDYDPVNHVIHSNDFSIESIIDYAPNNGQTIQFTFLSDYNFEPIPSSGFIAKPYDGGAIWFTDCSTGFHKENAWPEAGCFRSYIAAWSETAYSLRITLQ